MSDSTKNDTLCERCSLLSFDDLAIGGQEVVGKDGIARLHFPDARTGILPVYSTKNYRLVRLDWKVEDSLPDMPQLSHSSQLGCVFCQTLLRLLEDVLARRTEFHTIDDVELNSVAYLLLLVDKGIERLLVETTFNHSEVKTHLMFRFPIEADSSKSHYLAELWTIH